MACVLVVRHVHVWVGLLCQPLAVCSESQCSDISQPDGPGAVRAVQGLGAEV